MNYGLYLSASGVLTNQYRQDVFANNLANVETVGFKRDLPTLRQRPPEAIEQGLASFRHALLDKLGGGVLAGEPRTDFSPGPIKTTGNSLDVALETAETFFALSAADSAGGGQALRLTRDGRFTRDAEGYLTSVAGGHRLLDGDDRPIRLDGTAPVTIDSAGRLFQEGEEVARLQVTAVRDPHRLVKFGQNLFGWPGGEERTDAKQVSVRQGALESSGVDPIKALMQLIEATKAASNNANMIRYHDLLMDRAVNTLGRVA